MCDIDVVLAADVHRVQADDAARHAVELQPCPTPPSSASHFAQQRTPAFSAGKAYCDVEVDGQLVSTGGVHPARACAQA